MGCTSAKQVSAVPNDEEGRGKAYSNGDLFTAPYVLRVYRADLSSGSLFSVIAQFVCVGMFRQERLCSDWFTFLRQTEQQKRNEYKMKGVEEVKYMRGDENRVNARNLENL
ncbi:hypothetical protein FQN60_013391, partial [Etheostoma spectabile]